MKNFYVRVVECFRSQVLKQFRKDNKSSKTKLLTGNIKKQNKNIKTKLLTSKKMSSKYQNQTANFKKDEQQISKPNYELQKR